MCDSPGGRLDGVCGRYRSDVRSRRATARARNDIGQYDDLRHEWSKPDGAFAALHWLAVSRRSLIPATIGEGEILVDLGCGGGLTCDGEGRYVHVGIDLVMSALETARSRGVQVVRGDVALIPLADNCASVVVAGEILEHVTDVGSVVSEICRVLRPGGTVVIDTLSEGRFATFALVTIAERLPGGPPRNIHDPHLFIDAERLQGLFAEHGVELRVWGLRPSVMDYVRFLADRTRPVRMVRTGSTALVYQGVGTSR